MNVARYIRKGDGPRSVYGRRGTKGVAPAGTMLAAACRPRRRIRARPSEHVAVETKQVDDTMLTDVERGAWGGIINSPRRRGRWSGNERARQKLRVLELSRLSLTHKMLVVGARNNPGLQERAQRGRFDDDGHDCWCRDGSGRSRVELRTARNYAVIKRDRELGELSFPAVQEPTFTRGKRTRVEQKRKGVEVRY